MAGQRTAPSSPLRRLRRRLIWILVVYAIAGTVSQRLVPGVDEIFPFFGWSLFSRVPALETRYEVLIHRHDGRELAPAQPYLSAPDEMISGDRYVGRKVVQRLGRASDRGELRRVKRLRRQFEQNYLEGSVVDYELIYESFDPLIKWRSGENSEERSLGRFQKDPP